MKTDSLAVSNMRPVISEIFSPSEYAGRLINAENLQRSIDQDFLIDRDGENIRILHAIPAEYTEPSIQTGSVRSGRITVYRLNVVLSVCRSAP